ncbi:enoyl-CoA hydratase/isomerase family protein [Cryptosporangium japonicum]|uniref:enoyl-CoA hydratase/isomerase family protein n=1 Tax=Cryptosporangium japonicum TaxID=80872 RepID=UPI0031DCBDDD
MTHWDEHAVRALEALAATGRDLTGDVRVVVLELDGSLTPSGRSTTESFRARLAALSEAECDAVLAGYQDAVAWLRRADTVAVAAARGPLAGPAAELALSCDLRVFAHDVSVTFGGPPLLGVAGRLVASVGAGRAADLALTGRPVAAAEAERLGLATRVVPGSDLAAATDDLVAGLLAADRAVLAETKALFAAPTPAAERGAFARLAREP